MKRLISYFDWPEAYGRNSLKIDILAGLTVALVLIPQSMAYAELAGLPPYYGLYASFLPPIIALLVRLQSSVGHRPCGGGLTFNCRNLNPWPPPEVRNTLRMPFCWR